ncbi:MAG TPA: Ig-like domain-containing protein, partial [Verrucomicrobiae bacterium]|nr:Ig-like domain-containing protein [Verrucomicrobiae bacterium]
MRKKQQTKKITSFQLFKGLIIVLFVAGIVSSQLAEAVTSGGLYPTTTAITGTVTNPAYVRTDDNQNAGISTNNSSLTASGFSMGSAATSINSITIYWDVPSYTGNAGDDTVYFEYSLDSGATWKLGSSFTTSLISGWTFPRLVSLTDTTNIPANWTQSDISKVQVRIRATKSGAADGTVNADTFYINVDYNTADSLPPIWPSASSLSGTGTGPARVDLSWTNDATDNTGVTGWQIYRKLTSEGIWSGTPIQSVTGTSNSYSDTTVSPGTSYDYRIRARDSVGNTSSWSNAAAVTTPADTTGPTWTGFNSLNTNVISQRVDLSWTNNATDDVGVTGWEIYRKLNSETNWPSAPLATAAGAASSYPDSSVTGSSSYDYRIRAVDGSANVSVWSNTANAVTPDTTPPTVVNVTPVNGSTGVLRGSLIKITFSKAMNTSTFTIGSTFIIHDNTNNVDISNGQLTFEDLNRTAVFDSTDPLPANAGFTVTVTTGVKDAIGNALAANYVWGFSTGTNVFVSPHGNFTADYKACGICHINHTGAGRELIRVEAVDQLCYLCHDAGGVGSIYTVEDDFNTATMTSTHKVPGLQQCTDCHNPHLDSTAAPKLLQTATGANSDEQFCWTCHGTNSSLATDIGNDSAGNTRDHQSYYPQDG